MNKKYLQYSVLIVLLMVCKPSFAMYGAIFKAARVIGVTALPANGLYEAHKKDNQFKNECQKEMDGLIPITDKAINNWFEEKKKTLNIPNAESIMLVEGLPWGSFAHNNKGVVFISSADKYCLDRALIEKPVLEKAIDRNLKDLEILKQQQKAKRTSIDDTLIELNQRLIDERHELMDIYKKDIAEGSMCLKHELGHIINKDHQNKIYASVTIPFEVEAMAFGITSALRKICNIRTPKILMKTTLRSCSAVGAIVPKALINIGLMISWCRHREVQADKFACEHAESRLELERYANYFRRDEKSEWATKDRAEVRLLAFNKDPIHPAPVDRREMIETYIAKWDKEHPADEKS